MESIFISLSQNELKELIRAAVAEAIQNLGQPDQLAKEKIMTVKEAAVFLGLSKATIYNFTSRRILTHHKRNGGKHVYFRQSDLEQWQTEGRKKTVREIEAEAADFTKKKGGTKK
jgi:excisionase family DNA binding protein